MEIGALIGPCRHQREQRDGAKAKAEQQPALGIGGEASRRLYRGDHQRRPDPWREEGRLSGQRDERHPRSEYAGRRARSLKGEGRPVVLDVPDQGWRGDNKRDDQAEPWPRTDKPAAMSGACQHEQAGAGENKGAMKFRQHGEAAEKARGQPERRRRARRQQDTREAERGGEQGRVERAIGQHPCSRGHAQHGRAGQGDRRDQARGLAGEPSAKAIHQPRGERRERDEGRANDQAAFVAGEKARAVGQPPGERRMIEIADVPVATDGDHVGFIDAEARRGGEYDARQRGGADQGEDIPGSVGRRGVGGDEHEDRYGAEAVERIMPLLSRRLHTRRVMILPVEAFQSAWRLY